MALSDTAGAPPSGSMCRRTSDLAGTRANVSISGRSARSPASSPAARSSVSSTAPSTTHSRRPRRKSGSSGSGGSRSARNEVVTSSGASGRPGGPLAQHRLDPGEVPDHHPGADVDGRGSMGWTGRMTTVRAARNAVALAFVLNGLCFASLVSRVPDLRTDLGLDNGGLGLLLLAIAAGSVLALPSAGRLISRLGAAGVVRLGALGRGRRARRSRRWRPTWRPPGRCARSGSSPTASASASGTSR